MSDGFDGIGHGAGMGEMMEAGAKMNMQAREAEARLRRKHPGHEPPRRDGIVKRMIRRLRGSRTE